MYFHTYVLGKTGPIHPSFEVQFLMFFNPDRTHATPPIEILSKLQMPHLGYDVKNLSGVLGQPDVRDAATRIRDQFGLGRPSLLQWSIKESRAVPEGGVRHWGVAGFGVNPSRKYPPDGYDWPTLGRQFANLVDTVPGLLELAGPRDHRGSLASR